MNVQGMPVALERGLLVVELLNARPGGVAFGEIAAHLDTSNTSTMRLLQGLVANGYLHKGADRLYHLAPRAGLLGKPPDLHERLRRLGRSFLASLQRSTWQTAISVYHSGTHMICVDRVLHPDASPLQEPGHLVGELRAAPWGWWFRSVTGWREAEDVQVRPGQRSADNATIIAALEAAGAQGSTWHDSERRRLAAPVYSGERIVACLGLGGTRTSLPDEHLPHCRHQLERAAASLSTLLSRQS